jgi:hypothetical protein
MLPLLVLELLPEEPEFEQPAASMLREMETTTTSPRQPMGAPFLVQA